MLANVDLLQRLLEQKSFAEVREVLQSMNPVDVVHVLRTCSQRELVIAFRLLPKDEAVEVFEQMDPKEQSDLLASFQSEQASELFRDLAPDDRARLLDEVPAMVARKLLQSLDPNERERTMSLLGYEENTAGRYMTPDFVELRRDMTVAQALERIRKQALQKETIYYAYVIDEKRRLVGVVSLRDLVVADPQALISTVMTSEIKSVRTTTGRGEAANLLSAYDLLAVPVVDKEDRLVGILTWDDVLDIMQEEATEDIYHMAGVGVKEHADSPLLESATRRIPWLSFNMLWAFAGAAIIGAFDGTIQKVTAVAIFMPMIAGQAGNAGIQTATITIRSLALGEINANAIMKVLLKEWGLGLLKGAIFGTVLGLVAWAWKGSWVLGAVAGSALLLNMLVASTAGVLLPLTLQRLKIDPASIAGVFDTMLTDFFGFLIYLGIATLLVTHLT